MIALISNIILIFTFFFSGYLIQALKKLLGILTKYLFKILSIFGIKIYRKEKTLIMSEDFKQTYGDIRIVKLSKKNIKNESSIDWINFAIFIVASLLYILNLKALTGNAISNFLFILIHDGLHLKIISTAADANIMYTAVVFSVLSFSATKLWSRWRSTKQNRIERKQALLKEKAIALMDSKELLDNAKKKDKDKIESLKQ